MVLATIWIAVWIHKNLKDVKTRNNTALLVVAVSSAEAAMTLVRTERRGAIETAAQEAFLRDWAEDRYGDKSA